MKQFREMLVVLRDLTGQRSLKNLDDLVVVHVLDFAGNTFEEDFLGFFESEFVSFDNRGRVNSGSDEETCLGEEFSGEGDHVVGVVSEVFFLHFDCHDDEVGGGVVYVDFLEDRGSVVGDEDFIDMVHDQFFHTVRAVRSLGDIGDCFASLDISVHGFFQTLVVSVSVF